MNKTLSCILVTLGLFLGAYFLNTHVFGTGSQAFSARQPEVPSPAKYKHTQIADLKVGERVVVSTDDTSKPTQVDPATWKKVTLFAEETWEDGTCDTINIQTLVPPDWFTALDAKIGSIVPIPLDVKEMGLDENTRAKVTAIEPCPEIRAGPGRVILTTVNHLNPNVCELTFSSLDGTKETIRPTVTHRFYSIDRNDWIHIGDAKQGERLQGLGYSVLTVLSLKPTGTTERVYNMTVEEEHVYHVGLQNLLAHNTNCVAKLTDQEALHQAVQVKGILDKPVTVKQLAGAHPFRPGMPAGHYKKHGFELEDCAQVMNSSEKCFVGVYSETGRHVNVFYSNGAVVITDGLEPYRVITAYGINPRTGSGTAVDLSAFSDSPFHNEIIWK